MLDINEVKEEVNKEFGNNEYVTGYRMSQIVNKVLNKNLPPQMFYNYISKKMIKSVVIDSKNVVTKEVAISWIVKYVERNVNN